MPKRPASVITLEVDRNQRADGVPGKRVFQTAVMQLQMIPDRLSPCPGYLRARPYDGFAALLTTAPLTLSADTLFTYFKQQCYVEQGHHQWKTPLAVRPLFLKS